MLTVLLTRFFSLALRPLAVLFEALFIPESNFIVSIIPTSMILLAASSIPIEINFYKHITSSNLLYVREYTTKLLQLIAITAFLFLAVANVFFSVDILIAMVIVFAFTIEKMSDELCRYYEYYKSSYKWLLIQIFRALWMFILVFFSVQFNLEMTRIAIILMPFCICLLSYMLYREFQFLITINFLNVSWIIKDLKFVIVGLSNNGAPSFLRLIVSLLYSEVAHAYFILSQIAQILTISLSVKFIVLRRRLIICKPHKYFSLVDANVMTVQILTFSAILFLVLIFGIINDSFLNIYIFLSTLLLLEAISTAISSIAYAISPWLFDPNVLFYFYLRSIFVTYSMLTAVYLFASFEIFPVYVVPICGAVSCLLNWYNFKSIYAYSKTNAKK